MEAVCKIQPSHESRWPLECLKISRKTPERYTYVPFISDSPLNSLSLCATPQKQVKSTFDSCFPYKLCHTHLFADLCHTVYKCDDLIVIYPFHQVCSIMCCKRFTENWPNLVTIELARRKTWFSLPFCCRDIDKHLEANHCAELPSWYKAKAKTTWQSMVLMWVG